MLKCRVILIVAEKSSQGQDILDALSVRRAYMSGGVGGGTMENGVSFKVAATEGHLFRLAEPHDYDSRWADRSVEFLPIAPPNLNFQLKCTFPDRLKAIEAAARGATEICNACDAAREGEGIFWELACALNWDRQPLGLTRLWISNLEPNAIRYAFAGRRKATEPKFTRMAVAAGLRRDADWLYGINGSRCVTHYLPRNDGKKWGQVIGRVQTPVLKMIYDKSLARRQFKPIKFYKIFLTFRAAAGEFTAVLKNDPSECVGQNDTMLADARRAVDLTSKIFTEALVWQAVDSIEEKYEPPPPPFNLVELQRACSRIYHWSARRTEQAARRCYREHKAITYPGTESEQIPMSLMDEASQTFLWAWDTLNTRVGSKTIEEKHIAFDPQYIVEDDKIEFDHHAIMPLRTIPPGTDPDAALVWEMVARRFLTSMSPPALVNACSRRLMCDTGRDQYNAYCDEGVVKEPGWLMMEDFIGNTRGYGLTLRERMSRKWVDVNEPTISLVTAKLHDGTTTPPELHTYDSILGLMRVKKLGTAATRGEILESLVERDYVDVARWGLDVAPEGARLCTLLARHVPRVVSIDLAEELEENIAKVEQGKRTALPRPKFLGDVLDEITKLINILSVNTRTDIDPVCPFTGFPIVDLGDGWRLEGYPQIIFPKTYASRKMELSQWLDIIAAPPNKGVYLEGFKSRIGQTFGAHLACNLKAKGKKHFKFV